MTYQISRDGQEFGPYSLSDLQRYVGTGNVLLTDLARAEGTTEWLPVSQVVGTVPVMSQQAVAPAGYGAMPMFPDPPNLHWGLVLLFAVLTCGVFVVVWDLVQVLWLNKVQPGTKTFLYFWIFAGLYVLNLVMSFAKGFVLVAHSGNAGLGGLVALSALVTIGLVAMSIVYRFSMRTSLEQHFNGPDPVGLTLSGVMTFFFATFYFQYHFNRINEIKRAYRMTQGL